MKEKQPVYNCILYFTQYYVSHSIDPALKINVSKLFVFDVFYLSFIHSIFKVFTFYHQSIDLQVGYLRSCRATSLCKVGSPTGYLP